MVAQLSKFIDRSVGSKLTISRRAHVAFENTWVSFDTRSHRNDPIPDTPTAETIFLCEGIARKVVSHITQFSATLPLYNLVYLRLEVEDGWVGPTEGMDDVAWRHLLQFSAMKTLHVYSKLAGHAVIALEHMDAGALLSLELIFLAGQPASSVEKFIAIRKFSGRPVTVVDTEREFNERVKSYYLSK